MSKNKKHKPDYEELAEEQPTQEYAQEAACEPSRKKPPLKPKNPTTATNTYACTRSLTTTENAPSAKKRA